MNATKQAQHTPGPWSSPSAGIYGGPIVDQYATGPLIATTGTRAILSSMRKHGRDTLYETEANARRIVACVNACEGISTDDLHNGQSRAGEQLTGYGQACAERDALRAEVARLREALQKVLRAARCQDVDTDDYVAAMSTGRPLALALNEALQVALGESHSLTMPEVRTIAEQARAALVSP